MKIEICEQMVQSWLINCKNCQVAQTNWSISPIKDIDSYKKDISEYINYFVSALKNGVSSGEIDSEVFNTTEEDAIEFHKTLNNDGEEVSFMRACQMLVAKREAATDENGNIDFSKISILGRAGKARELQFVRQTEIDILGVELDNGQAKNIYLVDTAFHKDGLNYSDTVSSVTKKIIRAILVADIIFGTDVPVHIVFASPVCKSGPESKIKAVRKYIEPLIEKRPMLHGKLSHVSIDIYLNQKFAEEIYLPLRCKIDQIYGGSDLFMRSLNLAKAAETTLPDSMKAAASVGKKSGSTAKSGSSGVRKTTADEFSEFKAFVGTSSANSYCSSVRAIMKEMGINTTVDFEQRIDSAIDHCTQRKIAAITDKEKKHYGNCCAHLRKYKKYLESRKLHP